MTWYKPISSQAKSTGKCRKCQYNEWLFSHFTKNWRIEIFFFKVNRHYCNYVYQCDIKKWNCLLLYKLIIKPIFYIINYIIWLWAIVFQSFWLKMIIRVSSNSVLHYVNLMNAPTWTAQMDSPSVRKQSWTISQQLAAVKIRRTHFWVVEWIVVNITTLVIRTVQNGQRRSSIAHVVVAITVSKPTGTPTWVKLFICWVYKKLYSGRF